MFIILGMSLSSCSEDLYPDNPGADNNSGEGRVERYFSMRVLSGDGNTINSGDNDFTTANGSDFEHMVDVSNASENVIILINDDWTYYGYVTIDCNGMLSQGTTTSYPSEISYVGVIHSPDQNELNRLPGHGLLVLNAHKITDSLKGLVPGAPLEDILKLTDDAVDSNRPGMSGHFHTMTSTAYLEPDNGGWKHSILFKLDKSKIYDNRMQAAASPAAQAVVERMSSKFSISFPGAMENTSLDFLPDDGRAQVIVCRYINGHSNYNNSTWSCTVDAWGINKYESSSYYFKNIIGEGADTSSYPYSYGEDINTTGLPFFNGWNNFANHRTIWGKDPHYEDGIYPRQYRPAVDNNELDYYGFRGKPSLGYISYNQLSTDFSRLGTKEGVNLYSNENTFPDTRIGGLWQHDLGASELVLGAKIHINNVDEKKEDYDLFRNRIGVFYPSTTDFATYFIQTFNDQLASQASMSYRYYDWENPGNNSGTVMKTFKLNYDNYKLYYGNEPLTPEVMVSLAKHTIPATIENGDGKVIPWVNGMYIGRREIDPNTHEEIGDVKRLLIDNNDFISLIYDWIGSFDHFNKGRMVYAVPILHKASVQKVSDPAYRPAVGDYGVTRNCWYSFAINAINSLGSPVDDPNQKIIVYQSSLENSVLVETKVLDWHIFSTEVTLPDKLK